ncbi:MAG: hypothetical protein HKM04_11000 [Legionellales bacterium]|nr:hypothetical protein [Legionellales bacterium]
MSKIKQVTWKDIRERINPIAPRLVTLIDALNPDDSFPLYLATYPFGQVIGDEKDLYYPMDEGTFGTLTDLPAQIKSDLAYARNSIPMGMVLENSTELFIDDYGLCLPIKLLLPGTFFGLLRELEKQGSFHPSGLLKMTSGARSMFVVPSIADGVRYANLKRDYRIKTKTPNTLQEQHQLFTELYNRAAPIKNTSWSSTLLYFSGKWLEKMQNDNAWKELKLYLLEEEWRKNHFRLNQSFFELIFSSTQAKKNLKPNPYLADTTSCLLSVATGSSPAFVTATNEIAAPIKLFQEILLDSYGLKHSPVFMHPGYMNALSDGVQQDIYYSMNYPITLAFSPKSRKAGRVIIDLRELKHITTKFFDSLKSDESMCKSTIAYKIIKSIDVEYYHSKPDRHDEVLLSASLPESDPWLCKNLLNDNVMPFADNGAFFRACVRMSRKENQIHEE